MRIVFLALAALVTAVGCSSPAGTGASGGPAGSSGQSEEPRAPKILTVAVSREPTGFADYVTALSTSSGQTSTRPFTHDPLVGVDERGAPVLQLAVEQPSVARGTWRVNADGTMETTWKLRPGVKWQDGAPFTSADLLFTWQVNRDPELPAQRDVIVK